MCLLTAALGTAPVAAQTNLTLPPTADAYVQDDTSANTNFGTATTLVVKKTTSNFNRIAYLKFDLSSAAGATITSATLRLYGNNAGTSYTGSDTASSVADTTWTETGLTWNNKPALGGALASSAITSTAAYVTWDVTAYVQSQLTAGKSLSAFAVTMNAVPANGQFDSFNSKEASSNPPQLVVTLAPPAAPTNVVATALSSSQINLTWTASAGATSYNIKRSTVTGGPYTTVGSPTTASFSDTTVAPATRYYYVVTAVNAGGESAASAEVPKTTYCVAPTNLTATATSTQIGLTWTASSGATSYSLYRGTAAGGESTTAYKTGLTGTSYADTSVSGGTTYYYILKAVNAVGASASSNEATATPAQSGNGEVHFYPRASYASRMVGGKFQGSNDNATYTDLYTITTTPTSGAWNTVTQLPTPLPTATCAICRLPPGIVMSPKLSSTKVAVLVPSNSAAWDLAQRDQITTTATPLSTP